MRHCAARHSQGLGRMVWQLSQITAKVQDDFASSLEPNSVVVKQTAETTF
jgi:hypothetical protein